MKRSVEIVPDVGIPFTMDIVNEHAAHRVEPQPSQLSGQPRKFWRPDEVEQLQALAAKGLAPSVIASRLGRSETSVRHAARYRGISLAPIPVNQRARRRLPPLPYKRRRWSESDRAMLIKMVNDGANVRDIAATLGRTEAAIKLYLKRLDHIPHGSSGELFGLPT